MDRSNKQRCWRVACRELESNSPRLTGVEESDSDCQESNTLHSHSEGLRAYFLFCTILKPRQHQKAHSLLLSEKFPIGLILSFKAYLISEHIVSRLFLYLFYSLIQVLRFILIVLQACVVVSSTNGRLYKPRNAEKLIVHFSDLNLSQLDKWGTRILVEFLKQVIELKVLTIFIHFP